MHAEEPAFLTFCLWYLFLLIATLKSWAFPCRYQTWNSESELMPSQKHFTMKSFSFAMTDLLHFLQVQTTSHGIICIHPWDWYQQARFPRWFCQQTNKTKPKQNIKAAKQTGAQICSVRFHSCLPHRKRRDVRTQTSHNMFCKSSAACHLDLSAFHIVSGNEAAAPFPCRLVRQL